MENFDVNYQSSFKHHFERDEMTHKQIFSLILVL